MSIAQLAGGIVAVIVLRTLYPTITPADAAEALLPHPDGRAAAQAAVGA